ncbi:MAG TPA: NADP-dependent malic enzyme, partial [Massilia sp.]|nr:NADP-dependent malic enzyme [Massilia sp.]
RSDYPNQVNNVLCFPYIFRGALDCGATRITDEMKLACVGAIARLAEAEANDTVAEAYAGQDLTFGPDYIIPKPFDPRLMAAIAPAVAQAAADSGVAARPIDDMDAYRERLGQMIYHTGFFMKPVFAKAKAVARRVAYAEGTDGRVLRAVQTVVDEGLGKPVLIGAAAEVEAAIKAAGLRLQRGVDYELAEPDGSGDATLQGTRLLQSGAVDALICGMQGSYDSHLAHVRSEIGTAPDAGALAAMNALVLDKMTLFITDTY